MPNKMFVTAAILLVLAIVAVAGCAGTDKPTATPTPAASGNDSAGLSSMPDNIGPGNIMFNGTMPDGVIPDGTMPGGMVFNGTMPNGTMPNGTRPGDMMFNGTVPGGMTFNGTMPGGAPPGATTNSSI